MASNVFQATAYQIDQRVVPLVNVSVVGFPTTGVLLQNCIDSPTRSLSTGVSVYSSATVLATGRIYYFRETFAALVTLVNA